MKLSMQDTHGSVSASQRRFIRLEYCLRGCVGSRVVSVLDSGAESLGSNRSRDAVG